MPNPPNARWMRPLYPPILAIGLRPVLGQIDSAQPGCHATVVFAPKARLYDSTAPPPRVPQGWQDVETMSGLDQSPELFRAFSLGPITGSRQESLFAFDGGVPLFAHPREQG